MASLGISTLQLIIFGAILLIVVLGVIFVISDNRSYRKEMQEKTKTPKTTQKEKKSEWV
ncbi:MAG: hypothetical protein R3C61_03625 [Bacteroidia bacterium]